MVSVIFVNISSKFGFNLLSDDMKTGWDVTTAQTLVPTYI